MFTGPGASSPSRASPPDGRPAGRERGGAGAGPARPTRQTPRSPPRPTTMARSSSLRPRSAISCRSASSIRTGSKATASAPSTSCSARSRPSSATTRKQPLIIVNGHRISDPGEIGALPVEALRNLQVLPRGSAVKAGGKNNQRVISLTLRKTVRSATLTGRRENRHPGRLAWRARRGDPDQRPWRHARQLGLPNAQRKPAAGKRPRALSSPSRGCPMRSAATSSAIPTRPGEIDPLLSALAGQIVTVTRSAPPPIRPLPTSSRRPTGQQKPISATTGR